MVDRKLSFFRPHLDNLVFAVFPDDDALPVHSAGFVWSWLKRKRERYFQVCLVYDKCGMAYGVVTTIDAWVLVIKHMSWQNFRIELT